MRRAAHLLSAHATRWAAATEAGLGPATWSWARALTSSAPCAAASAADAAAPPARTTTTTTLVWPPPGGGVLDGVRALPDEDQAAPATPSTTTRRPAGQAGRPPRPLRAASAPAATTAARRPFPHLASADEVAAILSAAACDDVRAVDASARCTFTDHMVFATARSQRHAAMAAEAVAHTLSQKPDRPPGFAPAVEGDPASDAWLLVDAGSVIAHIFVGADVRAEYDVETLWAAGGGESEKQGQL
jgi:ribosome silencing factor RsfS/YbeB/iojap